MGRKQYLNQHQIIIDGDLSDATIESEITTVSQLDTIYYLLVWSGTTPIGTVDVQVSQGDGTALSKDNNFYSVMGGTLEDLTGNTGNGQLILENKGWKRAKLVYTRSSGTGTVQAYIAGTTVGA